MLYYVGFWNPHLDPCGCRPTQCVYDALPVLAALLNATHHKSLGLHSSMAPSERATQRDAGPLGPSDADTPWALSDSRRRLPPITLRRLVLALQV